MIKSQELQFDYIFETSWEVCNRVGGIYTVLSTRAKTLQTQHKDKIIFIGPDFWKETQCPFFEESKTVLKTWKAKALNENLPVRVGRWNIPGKPIAILVDFKSFFQEINGAYARAWENYWVNSLPAYGDYDEAAAFGIAAGKVMKSLYAYISTKEKSPKVIAHFNEWMTAFGLFYVKENVPRIATIFTTHATSIGRSIAANEKPLYEYLPAYKGDQMAEELNMVSKHSVEKAAAWVADCFTTVSDITAIECQQLLDKNPDVVTPNGFENDFVPKTPKAFNAKRNQARESLSLAVKCLTGKYPEKNAMFVGTCGRYEYKNKGLDLFIDSLKKLSEENFDREVIGFIMVPSHIRCARKDLQEAISDPTGIPLLNNFITHELFNPNDDKISGAIRWFNFENKPTDKVKIIFIPSYLNGDDGIFNKEYYDLLIGMDITVFPSYYEPWGYTPLESVAFSIPTITTSLSGFGQWIKKIEKKEKNTGVRVVERSDYNYLEVRDKIAKILYDFLQMKEPEVALIRKNAMQTSQKALWSNFISFYEETYNLALQKKQNN